MAVIVDWLRCYTVSNSNFEGRGTTSRAQEWALVKHSGMSCPRRPMSWRSKRLCWEGAPGAVAGEGAWQHSSAAWLTVSDFMVTGLVFGFSLTNHFDRVLPGGTCIAQPRWIPMRRLLEVIRHVPFDPSRTLLVGGGLLVLCSLPGLPVVK